MKYQTATGTIVDAFPLERTIELNVLADDGIDGLSETVLQEMKGSAGDYLVIKNGLIRIVDGELFHLTFKPVQDELQKIADLKEQEEYERQVLESLVEFEKAEAEERKRPIHPYALADRECEE